MGLSFQSVGLGAIGTDFVIKKQDPKDKIVAIAGNPNVGKSTVFNALTGLRQHTGNWPGKTVTHAQGYLKYRDRGFMMVDIPGCYSLTAHSAEEEVARDFICFGKPDTVVVVCNATCLERNMNLVLQTLEITRNVVVCVNLMDEAARKKIKVDLPSLSAKLGVPVTGASARSGRGIDALMQKVLETTDTKPKDQPPAVTYDAPIEEAISILLPAVKSLCGDRIDARWLSIKLLEKDEAFICSLNRYLKTDLLQDPVIAERLKDAENTLLCSGLGETQAKDAITSAPVRKAEEVCRGTVVYQNVNCHERDRRIDRILTGKWTGFPFMFLLLALVFYLTITGANYPSQLLADLLFRLEQQMLTALTASVVPPWLYEVLILGVYRVLSWVVSVMLPPMAIFFPLFTLLEDLGYLPRVAFNLDKCFKKCRACGKQALTMCMGFGCNAAGVVGCRIIDSPRERLIAILTNNFVPCNGRFPLMIAIISMFFLGASAGAFTTVASALFLSGVIVLGIAATFFVSRLLSATILKGVPSSFTLELPPYRKPQIGKVIVRSIFDRTLFVLGRAVVVAAPAGLVIWMMANIWVADATLLAHCTGFLDPFARLIGLDGVILMAFILGLPANEIVIPIIIMAYMAEGSLLEIDDLGALRTLFIENGWTWVTAVCTILFSLIHWPCTTTLLTIKKETQSFKWTAVSFLIPTALGILLCLIVASAARMFV